MNTNSLWPEPETLDLNHQGTWNPVDVALRILEASGQPMLARQLATKLARLSVPLTATALDAELSAIEEPRLTRDHLGRWRLTPLGPR